MRNSKQLSFWEKPSPSFGGSAQKKKCARPLATNRAIHIILKSSLASGDWSFSHKSAEVETVIEATAARFHIRLYKFANVGNHIHLLAQGDRREDLQNFLRVLPQAIAFLVTGTRKGQPLGKFWTAPAFTRIVEWGKDFHSVLEYIERNRFEGEGLPRVLVDQWFYWRKKMLAEAAA